MLERDGRRGWSAYQHIRAEVPVAAVVRAFEFFIHCELHMGKGPGLRHTVNRECAHAHTHGH